MERIFSKNFIFGLALAGIIFVALEVFSYILIGIEPFSRFFYIEKRAPNYSEHLAHRHPIFGWPAESHLMSPYRTAIGSRIDPFTDSSMDSKTESNLSNCVSVYGESVMYGFGLPDDQAWTSLLARRLRCRVENFAVNAYGTDQALLRYEANDFDDSSVTILGQSVISLFRNANQFRPLIKPDSLTTFKPRFILSPDGALVLVPMPEPKAAEYPAFLHNPGAYLTHEFFLPGSDAGIVMPAFPYTLSLLKAVSHFRVRAQISGRAVYEAFLDSDHPSNVLALTTAIYGRFHREVMKRHGRAIALIVPSGNDIKKRREKKGLFAHRKLLIRIQKTGIEAPDLGMLFDAKIRGNDVCHYYFDCGTHLNAAGNELLSKIVADLIHKNRETDNQSI